MNYRQHHYARLYRIHKLLSEIMFLQSTLLSSFIRGTKRLVSVNICSVKGNSADIFGSKVSPGIFVVKEK